MARSSFADSIWSTMALAVVWASAAWRGDRNPLGALAKDRERAEFWGRRFQACIVDADDLSARAEAMRFYLAVQSEKVMS